MNVAHVHVPTLTFWTPLLRTQLHQARFLVVAGLHLEVTGGSNASHRRLLGQLMISPYQA
jgi:hypothetical protein